MRHRSARPLQSFTLRRRFIITASIMDIIGVTAMGTTDIRIIGMIPDPEDLMATTGAPTAVIIANSDC
jgi:hypothetical protein